MILSLDWLLGSSLIVLKLIRNWHMVLELGLFMSIVMDYWTLLHPLVGLRIVELVEN